MTPRVLSGLWQLPAHTPCPSQAGSGSGSCHLYSGTQATGVAAKLPEAWSGGREVKVQPLLARNASTKKCPTSPHPHIVQAGARQVLIPGMKVSEIHNPFTGKGPLSHSAKRMKISHSRTRRRANILISNTVCPSVMCAS